MRSRPFFLSLLVTASIVSALLAVYRSPIQAQAVTRDVTFVLHKRVYQSSKDIPAISENVHFSENSPQLKNSKGINGAVYNAYNVSVDYWQLAAEGKTNEQILTTLKAEASQLTTDAKKVAEVATTTDTTFGEGVARISLPELVTIAGQQKYGVYLFNEKSSPISGESQQTGAFIVSLPISEVNAQQPYIHVYPKSTIRNQLKLTKKLNENKQSFSYGAPIEYVIETTIPANTLYLSKYTLLDTYDAPLDYVAGSLRVYINDVEKKDIFTFIEDLQNNRFSLEATGTLLREKGITAGSKVRIVYQMILSNQAVPDVPYDNTVRLLTLFEGSEQPELIAAAAPVETGGKNFIKIDMDQQTKGLPGAIFLVKDTSGNYLLQRNGTFQWSSDRSNAYQLTSDVNGNFSIQGLNYGSYKLIEIQAPDGYKSLDEEIPFTIESGSYRLGDQPTSPLRIVNAKTTNDSEVPAKSTETNLPKMGVMVSTSIIVMGSMLLSTVGLYFVRRRKR